MSSSIFFRRTACTKIALLTYPLDRPNIVVRAGRKLSLSFKWKVCGLMVSLVECGPGSSPVQGIVLCF